MINADKLGKLDARYRAGTRSDTEFAAEEAKLLDELLAAADLSSPTVPEVRPDDQAIDAETASAETTWQAPAPDPELPDDQAVPVWPSAYGAGGPLSPEATDTTTIESEAAQPAETRPAWTLGDHEQEEMQDLPQELAKVDLDAPLASEVPVSDQATGAESPHIQMTWQAPPPSGQSEERSLTTWPSAALDPDVAATASLADTTTADSGQPPETDKPRQAWSLDSDLEADEPTPTDDLPARVEMSSASLPGLVPVDSAAETEAPHPAAWQSAAPEPAEEPAVTVWPSTSGAAITAVPTVRDGVATYDAEPVPVEQPRQAWSLDDAAPSVVEPEIVAALAAVVDLSVPTTPEPPSDDETSDAEAARLFATSPAPLSAPDQPNEQATGDEQAGPEEQPVMVWPSAYQAATAAATTVDDPGTKVDAEEPGRVKELHLAQSPQVTELAGEEPPADAPAASITSGLPSAPEGSSPDQASGDEIRNLEVPSPEPPEAAEEPQDQAATEPSSPESSQTAVTPALSATTTREIERPREFEARYHPWTLRSARLAAEEPKLFEEPAAPVDLASPSAPEALSPGEASEAETQNNEVTPPEAQATEQPETQPVPSWPSAVSTETPASPSVAGATTPDVDKPREFEASYRPWTLRSARLAAEEPKLFEEPAATAETASPSAPEARSPEQASDAETVHAQVPQPEAEAPTEQPETQPVRSWPSAVSTETPASPSAPGVTTPEVEKPQNLDARYRAWAFRAAKLVDEEPKPVDTPPASAGRLASPSAPEVSPPDKTSDAETPPVEETSPQQLALRSQPERRQAPSWPSAFGTRAPASPDMPEATTTSADKPQDLDARYRAWILRAAGEPTPTGKPAADPASPVAREVPVDDTSATAETPQPRVTPQAPTAAPNQQQVRPPVATPSPDSAPKPAGPSFTGTTVARATKPAKPESPIRAWNFRDIATAFEEPTATGEPHDSVGPSASATPADDTSDAGAPSVEAASQATPSAPEQSPEAAAPPAADSEPEPTGTNLAEAATAIAHKPGKLDARYRPWTMSAGELAAETEEPLEPPAADALVSPSVSPDVPDEEATRAAAPPGPETGQAVTASPSPYSASSEVPAFSSSTTMSAGTKPRRDRFSPRVVGVLALVFLLTTLAAGFIALKQSSSARQWRQYDHSAAAFDLSLSTRNGVLARELATARATIASQNSALNGQIKSLEIQLSSALNSKQKAFAKTPLFTQIASQALTASNEASVCAGEMGSLQTEITDDIANPSHKDPLLQGNTKTANLVCGVARQDDQQLQTTLHNAG